MALGPKEMEEAILRNLPSKTGRSLEEWFRILSNMGYSTKADTIQFLKIEHKLGHFQAQKVYERFIGQENYAAPETFAATLFSVPESIALFTSLRKQILQIDKKVVEKPCRTYIPYYHRTQFAVVKPGKSHQLQLGLALPDHMEANLFTRSSTKASRRVSHWATLLNAHDIEAVLDSIYKAYHFNS